MVQIRENISLRPYHTFGINVSARYFSSFTDISRLNELLDWKQDTSQRMVLGGGSNILFTADYNGLVLQNALTGIDIIREDDTHIYVTVGAGENWHQFVMFCVGQGYAGIENLSLIPGNVGASPMQNIGAYGVEIKDVFFELEAMHLPTRSIGKFSREQCEFGYRDSVFKSKYKDQFIILSVTYRLNKIPQFNTSYGAIQQELEKMGVDNLSIAAISQAVINIRSSKLPDPKDVGNAGSFFKNPKVEKEQFNQLQEKYSSIPSFPFDDSFVKVPAGWLIEQCGWKGYRRGDAGCYSKQALVLVNYGDATGNEIYQLSEEIRESVKNRFNINLEKEVNII